MRALSKRGNLIPVYAELATDLETPVSLFLKLSGAEPAFLLESVDGGERIARYSFMGVRMKEALCARRTARFTAHADRIGGVQASSRIAIPQPPIETRLKRHARAICWMRCATRWRNTVSCRCRACRAFAAAWWATPVTTWCANLKSLPNTAKDVLGVPEAVYMLTDTLAVFDHAKHRLLVIANAFIDDDGVEAAYADAMARIKTILSRMNAPHMSMSPDPTPNARRQVEQNPVGI